MNIQPISPQKCATLIQQSKMTIALSGAGISTAAGIPDFRGPGGIFSTGKYDGQLVFDIDHFHHDPSEFFRFTRDLAATVDKLQPTFTHEFLARLETAGLLEAVVTQNIDPLHAMAGSQRVVSVHGSYATSHCLACGKSYDYQQLLALLGQQEIPRCDCESQGLIKPDVVFFGEAVTKMPEAQSLAAQSELMLVLGSSLTVYPVAMLPGLAGGAVVIVNTQPVQLPPAPNRYFAAQSLDSFFRQVATEIF